MCVWGGAGVNESWNGAISFKDGGEYRGKNQLPTLICLDSRTCLDLIAQENVTLEPCKLADVCACAFIYPNVGVETSEDLGWRE